MYAILISAAVVLVVVVVAVISMFNRLVTLKNRFKNAYAQIDVQSKRRYDLIPNLVEVAKGYMAHERQTLEAVIAARNTAASANATAAANPAAAGAIQGVVSAEIALNGQLGQFLARVEAYPDLKANQSMKALMEELTSTENRVAFARQAYNDAVTLYNTQTQTFPSMMVAGMFAFQPAPLFEVSNAAEREVVQVSMK